MPLPPLPSDLTPLLLPFLLPPTPPLPPHLLSPLFRHRLIYLPPDDSGAEMDRQLSPFPMSITSEALQRRLEALAGGYTVGPVRYAWDGESGVARRSIEKEGVVGDVDEEGVELMFQHDEEEGWGFHGLRLPGSADEMGLKWVQQVEDVSTSTSTSTSTGESSVPISTSGTSKSHSTGVNQFGLGLDGYGQSDDYGRDYTAATAGGGGGGQLDQAASEAEVQDYWAGFSPPSSPPVEPTSGTAIDDEERERQYWAQYSNGPTPDMSRRQSGVVPTVPTIGRDRALLDAVDEMDGASGSGSGLGSIGGRDRAATIQALSASRPVSIDQSPQPGLPPSPNSGNRPIAHVAIDPRAPSQSTSPPNPSSSLSSTIPAIKLSALPDRLRMKTLSLLSREWTQFTAGIQGGQGELEERGIRWLAIGREVDGAKSGAGSGAGAGGDGVAGVRGPNGWGGREADEERVRSLMSTLKEMWEVFGDLTGGGDGDRGGFYRVVEQALGAGVGAGGGGGGGEVEGEGGGGGGDIPRNYSFDQNTYWE